jgi:mercuric ion transport protein
MIGTGKQNLLTIPSVGVALLPKLACPMCWPVYASILTSVGLGFLVSTTYLFLITAGFLLIAMGVLGFRAKQRRGYGPLMLGLSASAAILTGKFQLESKPIIYGGVGVLVIASVWNTWPRRAKDGLSCPHCIPEERVEIHGMHQGRT